MLARLSLTYIIDTCKCNVETRNQKNKEDNHAYFLLLFLLSFECEEAQWTERQEHPCLISWISGFAGIKLICKITRLIDSPKFKFDSTGGILDTGRWWPHHHWIQTQFRPSPWRQSNYEPNRVTQVCHLIEFCLNLHWWCDLWTNSLSSCRLRHPVMSNLMESFEMAQTLLSDYIPNFGKGTFM